jgi:4-oxalocrotonate tautomerase
MPYVNVRVTPGISTDQSRQIVEEITDTLVRVLNKNPEHTHIVIDEIDQDRWGFAGKLTSEM